MRRARLNISYSESLGGGEAEWVSQAQYVFYTLSLCAVYIAVKGRPSGVRLSSPYTESPCCVYIGV